MFKKQFRRPLKRQPERNLHYYTLNGILFTIVTIFTRSYAPKFLDRLGASSLHYSLFNALPGLIAVLTTIPGILLIQRAKDKSRLMRLFFYISRFFPLILLGAPYLPQELRGYAFVLCFSLMNLPENIGQTALQSWTRFVFEPHQIASALSLKNKSAQMTTILASALVGVALSLAAAGGSGGVILVYQALFALSVVFGLFEIRALKKIREISLVPEPPKLTPARSLKQVLSHRPFTTFLACSLLFHFGWQMGWPLFSYYQIEYLRADEKWLTIMNVINSLAMVLSYNLWASLIRRKGYPFVIAVVTAGMSVTPILFALSRTLLVNTVMGVSTGIFTAGITVVILGSLLESASPDEVLLSAALHQTLISITLFISPFIGELLLRSLGIHKALYFTALFRFIGSAAFFVRWITLKSPDKLRLDRLFATRPFFQHRKRSDL